MKKLLFALLMFTALGAIADQSECEKLKTDNATYEQLVQSGCCSHHGGVCGCYGGRAQCCDGVLSPSCGCIKEDSKEIKNLEINQPKS